MQLQRTLLSAASLAIAPSAASAAERHLATSVDFPSGLTNLTNSDAYHMKTVRVVQARVQGDKPAWNDEYGMFVSKYYTDFEEAYRAVLDTVNLASVEGALMYVQAEGINYNTRGSATAEDRCTRKNGMKYVVFYDIVVTQTNETLAQYESEYGTYIAMDSGHCTETSGSGDAAVYPTECYYLNGTNGQPNLGPFVGGEARDTDARAPYPNTWWYSFPNTCPLDTWAEKTDECRATTRGGLCPFDTKPDGIQCTFNYRILGWVPIDDLVGITSMEDANGNKYANFSEFCLDGGVEFNATTEGEWIDGIDFWKNPQNETANAARATKLVELYTSALEKTATLAQVSEEDLANFKALPTITTLRDANPPCYENVAGCASAANGCKRSLYGQICTVCETEENDCVKAPSDFIFPTLTKATASPSASTPTPTGSGDATESPSTGSSGAALAPALSAVVVSLAFVLVHIF